MAGHADRGKAFLEEVLGKLPENLRTQASTLLSSPESQAALEYAGSQVSPLDEERQRLNALKNELDTRGQKLTTWRGELDSWAKTKENEYTERERKIAEREAGGGGNGTPPAAPGAGGTSLTKDDVTRTVTELVAPREAGLIQYVADATNFGAFHLKHFNEPLDVNAIVRHEKIGELGFRGVYELLHQDKLAKIKADADKAREDAIRADERQKVLGERPAEMPYPIGEGSPLDVLALDPDKRPKGDPAAAARMYESLVGANAGR